MNRKNLKIIISGGGTGGHIFPAISIANALKKVDKNIDILFVGAEGKMEMEKVPNAGYPIIGLPIQGLQRRITFQNIIFFIKLFKSLRKSKKILKKYQPDVVVGVGGYASGPLLYMASKSRIPTLIQEQNSYAGITNKLLAKKAGKICVAYDNMERFFPKEKIVFTGNPVRQDLLDLKNKKQEAAAYFKLRKDKKTLLVLGGSLGAKTINQSISVKLAEIQKAGIQVIWQTGKYYFEKVKEETEKFKNPQFKITDFIKRMDLAYALADVIISRAGAGTVSELCLVGKPSILVPSPNVSEDHQTKNAMALVIQNAAIMIKDEEAPEKLINKAFETLQSEKKIKMLSKNIRQLAVKNSAELIIEEIFKIINY